MTTFTIELESNRINNGDLEPIDVQASGTERFSNETELANLTADWPMAKLIAIWKSLPGVNSIKKFTDRKTAIARIWGKLNAAEVSAPPHDATTMKEPQGTEIAQEPAGVVGPEQQPTVAPVGEQAPDVAPVEPPAKQKAARKKKTPTAPAAAKGSKTAAVVELLQRDGGVTAQELMAVTGWQAHSLRGFVSGTLGKKMGLTVRSTKNENGERTYRVQ